MKFHEMPYERVQLPDVTHAYEELIKELQAARAAKNSLPYISVTMRCAAMS